MIADPALWQSLPLPVIVLGPDDRVADLNAPAEGFVNRSGRAAAGTRIQEIVDVDGGLDVLLARARRDGGGMTMHSVGVHVRPGPRRDCDLHFGTLPGGGMILLAVPQDIAGRLDRARTSRSAARSAIGMAEMLAHEIKNPLAGITGAAQLLEMGLTGEDVELTQLIVAETRRIVKLLDQVEQFGDNRGARCRAVNLHDVLDRAIRSATLGVASHMVLKDAYDPSLPLTWADPDQLLQVVLNLLKNAAEAADGQGTIVVRTFYDASLRLRRPDGTGAAVPLQVEVEDDGPGIPPEMTASLFEPFVSGRENGTGLGLALVAKIVADHDGLVSVESRPGRTAFRISLPLAREG